MILIIIFYIIIERTSHVRPVLSVVQMQITEVCVQFATRDSLVHEIKCKVKLNVLESKTFHSLPYTIKGVLFSISTKINNDNNELT